MATRGSTCPAGRPPMRSCTFRIRGGSFPTTRRRPVSAQARSRPPENAACEPDESRRVVACDIPDADRRPAPVACPTEVALHLRKEAPAIIGLHGGEAFLPGLPGFGIPAGMPALRPAHGHGRFQHVAHVAAHAGRMLAIVENDLAVPADRKVPRDSDVELVIGGGAGPADETIHPPQDYPAIHDNARRPDVVGPQQLDVRIPGPGPVRGYV